MTRKEFFAALISMPLALISKPKSRLELTEIETRRFQIEQIAKMYRVDVGLLDGLCRQRLLSVNDIRRQLGFSPVSNTGTVII